LEDHDPALTRLATIQQRLRGSNRCVFFVQYSYQTDPPAVTKAVDGVCEAGSSDDFDDEVYANASCELEGFGRPVGSFVVVDQVRSPQLARKLEFLVG
jgi:hypothetical protein